MRFKKIIGALLFAIAIAAATPAAQAAGIFRFGVKAGLTVDKLKFNTDLLDSDNKTGYTFGVMTKFTVPVVNLGFDASVMYTHREFDSDVTVMDADGNPVSGTATFKNNYIEIPVNFRYDIGLPGIGKVITPFLTTGPDFSFLVSKRHYDFWNQKKCDVAWNFGFGLIFVDHLQLHASYGLGLTNSGSGINDSLHGKSRFWNVTAAWLF